MSIKQSAYDVCSVADVPERTMRCFEVVDADGGRHQILVAHTEAGFTCTSALCSHEDVLLCDGNLSGTVVRCPLHGSRFDLTSGSVLDEPAEDDIRVYPVSVRDERIQVII